MSTPTRLELIGLPGLPLVRPGDDLAALLLAAAAAAGLRFADGDVLAVAQKIVSKAEGRYADLAQVRPSAEAVRLAEATQKDPRQVELILSESKGVVRHRPGVVIAEHRLGFVMANAGIDASNVERGPAGEERVLLLPRDPDGSAARLRADLAARAGADVAVIVNDSVGRAWRNGTVGIALGSAGLPAYWDRRGENDLFGRPLRVTQVALADELAAAASVVQGQAGEGTPAVLLRGLDVTRFPAELRAQTAQALLRPPQEDLFR